MKFSSVAKGQTINEAFASSLKTSRRLGQSPEAFNACSGSVARTQSPHCGLNYPLLSGRPLRLTLDRARQPKRGAMGDV